MSELHGVRGSNRLADLRAWLNAGSKRSFDIVVSGLGILCTVPLWVVIALAIKREDRGPVFYIQERVGRDGHRFRSLKFRTMIPEADRQFGPLQAGIDDPRVTRSGRWLRATAMDELPQLFNILKGDMTFVGPRALAPTEIEQRELGAPLAIEDIPGYLERHRVRPGLTGIAQVFAPRDVPRRQKFRYDQVYIKQQSFWLDLWLIAVSVWISLRARWESRADKI